jgi:hypothetical protein
MGTRQLPSAFKVCATCTYWGGPRSTDSLRAYSVFDDKQKGECLGGGFNRLQMSANATCGRWQKWSVLR